MQAGPDGGAGDDGGRRVVGDRVGPAAGGAGEGDARTAAVDEGVGAQVGRPVRGQVVGAAGGGEADLFVRVWG